MLNWILDRILGPERGVLGFPARCEEIVAPLLNAHGFSLHEKKFGDESARMVYTNGARYVDIGVGFDFRDAPFRCWATLGEGALEWPERDWNGIELLWLVNEREPGRFPKGHAPYQVKDRRDFPAALAEVASDLRTFADDFLTGDVSRFRELRAEVARMREPYKIFSPDSTGRYRSRLEPNSVELKERFSRPE